MDERVAQLLARLGTLDHCLGVNAVGLVAPEGLDILDTQLVGMVPSPVDGEVAAWDKVMNLDRFDLA